MAGYCRDGFGFIVADKAFTDWSPDGSTLRKYAGRKLFFPDNTTLRPHPKYLAWHREKCFRG